MTETKDINKWVKEALQDNPKAQTYLLNTYWNAVYNYIYYKIQNEEDAEDITIQSFTKAFSKLHLYNDDFDLKTWIISIAHNTMIDQIKKKKLVTSYQEIIEAVDLQMHTPEEALIHIQNNENLIHAIQRLKGKYKQVIELFYLEEKSYKEIAEILDISMSNVKILLLRAKNILANYL